MDVFKKLVPSKRLRFRLISLFKFVPDKAMLKFQYRMKCGRKLNLDDPKRYTEKIQWYKLYYRDDKMPVCADKYLVREYVKERGYGHLLNDLYGVYQKPEDIDISTLPKSFVLKLSNGSNTNLFVTDKSKITNEEIRSQFKHFKKQSGSSAGREWPYHIKDAVIIAEKLMTDDSSDNQSLDDYKFLCFGGKPEYIVLDKGRFTDHRRNIYDTNWNDMHIGSDCAPIVEEQPKPKELSEMLEIAAKLSEGFPAARIDLYLIEGKIIFGEITFFPWSGYVKYDPDAFDFELGKLFVLPERNDQ